jgi:hypothetical protein
VKKKNSVKSVLIFPILYPTCLCWLAVTCLIQVHYVRSSNTWLAYTESVTYLHKENLREVTFHECGSQEIGLLCPVQEGVKGFLNKQAPMSGGILESLGGFS